MFVTHNYTQFRLIHWHVSRRVSDSSQQGLLRISYLILSYMSQLQSSLPTLHFALV